MNKYIVILSVGPVQGFIAAARRSRDLWSGSWLLSELSKACALALHKKGADLIFPAITSESDLQAGSPFSVGNKIQAVITAENTQSLTKIIEQAKAATKARFIEEADKTLKEIGEAKIRTDVWQQQKDDYTEIQSAWAKIDTSDSEDGYRNAVELAGKVLASRKATRDFDASCTEPYEKGFMLPKSSLDGVRETVLDKDNSLPFGIRAQLGLSKSEQLDCVGMMKRLGFGKAEQFTAITRVAADAWIEALTPDELDRITADYEPLVGLRIATRVNGNIIESEGSIYKDFPYDAQFLYENRIDAALVEYPKKDNQVNKLLTALKKTLQPIWKEYGQPQSYSVLLLADGDKMGELIDKAQNEQEHQAITKALSAFAGRVRETMQDFKGHCIYAGGDDVLGLIPLHKAYACSQKLSESFSDALKDVSKNMGANTPTLSVGLAICHQMTPFAVIRELAKQAEQYAKGDHILNPDDRRNALGFLLSIRSGADIKFRLRWNDANAHEIMACWVKCYNDKTIPSRVAYSIRDIALQTEIVSTDDESLQKNIRLAELNRMLKQARTNQGKELKKDDINKLTERAKKIGLKELANELLVARWLAAKTQQELGRI